MQLGVGLSSEELDPGAIVRTAARAEEAGFRGAWVSDHFHPWIDAQGESPFVWSVLGAIAHATEGLEVGTGVTCPIMRMHPAIVAHAAATTQEMFDGRFWLGVGTGEALNEHILGDRWPATDVRLEMLEEAIAIMRLLWEGGQQSYYGDYFTVENARIYTLPGAPIPVLVSAFGPKALALAARVGDGLVTTKPDADALRDYEAQGGRGPKVAQLKVAYAESVEEGGDLAFERWPTSGLAGELSQVLPTPAHFEQAVAAVRREDVVEGFPCGPDPQTHIDAIRKYSDADFDRLYITQVGPNQEGFLRFYEREVLPACANDLVTAGDARTST
jgi:G6PDH family F420-dependent oxidoreductase